VHRSLSRSAATAALAVLLPLGLAACGADANVSKSDISTKLKSDSQFKVLNDKQRDCLADLMLKKGNKGDLKKWVDGKKKIEDVRGDSNGIEDSARKCATG
jgi:hypothetical protein